MGYLEKLQPIKTEKKISQKDYLSKLSPVGMISSETIQEKSAIEKVGEFLAPTITKSIGKIRKGEKLTGREMLGSGLEAASFLVPAGAIGKGIGIAAKVAKPLTQRLITGSIIGATTGGLAEAGRSVGEGEDIGEITKRTISGAAIGAPLGAAVPLIGAGISKFGRGIRETAKITPSTRLQEMTKSLKTLQNVYDEGIRYTKEAGKRVEISNPIKTINKYKLVPKVVEGKVDATNIIQSLSDELDNLAKPRKISIEASKKSIPFNIFKNDVLKTIRQSKELQNSGMIKSTLKKANNLLLDYKSTFGKRLNLETLDNIRITMNKRFDPELKDVFRAIGDAARQKVYLLDKTSRPILQKEGEILAAKRFAEVLQGKTIKGGRLGGYVSQVIGSIVGASTQIPVAGPILGAIGGKAVQKRIQQRYFQPISAGISKKIIKVGERAKGLLPTLRAKKLLSK